MLSVSKIESYRMYRSLDIDVDGWEISIEDIIQRLRGQDDHRTVEEIDRMQFGSDCHYILETGCIPEGWGDLSPDDNRSFYLNELLKDSVNYDDCIKEAYTNTDISGITVSLKIDAIDGIIAYDHKFSAKPQKRSKFEDSMQWRLYLLATGLDIFIYNTYHYGKDRQKSPYIRNNKFTFNSYNGMKNDCEYWVFECASFMNLHGIKT